MLVSLWLWGGASRLCRRTCRRRMGRSRLRPVGWRSRFRTRALRASVFRTSVRLCCWWPVCLRASCFWSRLRPIGRHRRRRVTCRLRGRWPVWCSRRRRGRTISRSRSCRLSRPRCVGRRSASGRCRRLAGWRNFYRRTRCRRGTQGLHLAAGDGFAGMRGQCLLLLRKRHRRRRRSFLGDYLTARHCRWRRSYVTRGGSFGSEDALASRGNRNSAT